MKARNFVATFLAVVLVSAVAFAGMPKKVTLSYCGKKPVEFSHASHVKYARKAKEGCKACHHDYKGKRSRKKCSACHACEKKEGVPSLKKVFHNTCRRCHAKVVTSAVLRVKNVPIRCRDCHVKPNRGTACTGDVCRMGEE